MPSKTLHIGDMVMSADGKALGIVSQLGDTCFRVDAKRKRDFWLSNDAVDGRDKGVAVLLYDENRLGDAFVDVLSHTGAHSHPKQPKQGGSAVVGIGKPLMMLAGGAFWVLRDKERRDQAMKLVNEVKTRVQQKKEHMSSSHDQDVTPGYSATSTFVSPSTPPTPTPASARTPEPPTFYQPTQPVTPTPHMAGAPLTSTPPTPTPVPHASEVPEADLKAREEALVKQVTEAFPRNSLRVSPVAVHTLEGREVETLRFTVDEMASSDVQLERLGREGTSESAVAEEIIQDLRQQLPQEQSG